MKVSVIISICDNRLEMFRRSLNTWSKQTMLKNDFELIIVDDAQRDEIIKLCKEYQFNFQFIRIDNSLCDVPITTFTPVLSNNVGFRMAKGEVVCVTGPETLQAERNLEIAYTLKDRRECAYGLIYKSNSQFTKTICENWNKYNKLPVDNLLRIQGAAVECLTKPPHPPAYWYFMTVNKKYIENICGVDEQFGQGFCAEDDDFANRMRMSGVKPVFEHRILGIHQDHSEVDKINKKHSLRRTADGKRLRQKNIDLMINNLNKGKMVANEDHLWGDPKVITYHEIKTIGE